MKPRVLITIGDPSGIGPEVTLKALASPSVSGLADFLVIGDRFVIDTNCRTIKLKLKAPLRSLDNVSRGKFSYGKADPAFGRASIDYLDDALRLLKAGCCDALVTGPINKSSIRSAGFQDFKGHTEYLACNTGSKDFAMMFVGKAIKITLVTRHIALKDVPRSLTMDAINRAIVLTGRSLKKLFGIRNPRIGVAGLNPHAGENSAFGTEEAKVITPAIRKASTVMRGISGPFPPDVIFHDALKGKFDAVVSMYHDQALIPFKLLYFEKGVNLTLGLPFVRTSPDHGTALDIAGRGIADPASMIEAVRLACRLAKKS